MKVSGFLILLFVCITVFSRFYQINTIPPDLEVDGSIHGIHALKISDGINLDFLIPRTADWFWLYCPWHIFIGLLFKIFGAQKIVMAGANACISIVTIACIFTAGRRLFGERTGLISAFFAATSLWYITYSRYVLGFITAIPLLSLVILCNLYLYDERKRAKYLVYAGILSGLGFLNGYPHILFVLPVYFGYKMWREHGVGWAFDLRYIALILIAAAIYTAGAAGMAWYCKADTIWEIPKTSYDYFINFKAEERGVLHLQGMPAAIKHNLSYLFNEFFIKAGEQDIPAFKSLEVEGYPLITPVASILLILGIIKGLKRRSVIDKLLLTWVFLPVFLYVLTTEKISSRYLLGIFPAICLISGNEASCMISWLYGRFSGKFARITVFIFIIFICGTDFFYLYKGYFINYAENDGYLNKYYGIKETADYIEKQIGGRENGMVVFENTILTPPFAFYFYTKGRYYKRFYFWDEFRGKFLLKDANKLKNKTIVFVFSNPDDSRIKIYGKQSELDDFKKYYYNLHPSKIIRYRDGTERKFVFCKPNHETPF